ncbi:MAG: fibronectin type III domain-containing protein, partial [Treponema sp.]|nr:fibronectin type III domain-containing protein [Treponema sp.]
STQVNGQQVRWNGETFDNTGQVSVRTFPLLIDPLNNKDTVVQMEVYWKDPNDNSDESVKTYTYTFTITRLSPNRDSTLKSIIIQDAKAGNYDDTSYTYEISDFKAPGDDINYDGPIDTNYTVYVPYTVNSIKLMGEYLSTSEIYNEKGRPALNGTGAPNLPNPPYPKTMEDFPYTDYPDDIYLNSHTLKLYLNGWVYPLPNPGVYNFYINVKPQNDTNETLTRHYIITVIKTDSTGNAAAQLDDLTVQTDNDSRTLLGKDLDVDLNPFKTNLLNYTVYVPNDTDYVNLGAVASGDAKISVITSVSLIDPKVGDDNLDYPTLPVSSISDLRIDLPGLSQKRVTFTVINSKYGNSTPKNYTVTLIKCLPAIASTPELTGAGNSLKVSWDNYDPNTRYDVCYSLYTGDPALDIPEKAWIWPINFKSGDSISGLGDNKKYNVWVRPKDSTGTPGDWKQAETSSLGSMYGIPGAAELLKFGYSPDNAGNRLSPDMNSSISDYVLYVPAAVSSVSLAPVLADGATAAAVTPAIPATLSAGEFTATSTITVTPPDKNTANNRNYTLQIFRNFPAPGNVSVVTPSLNGSVTINWTAASGAGIDNTGVTYEIYYYTSGNEADRDKYASKVGGINGTSAVISSLSNTTPYYFWVRAVKGGTPGEWSSYVTATPRNSSNMLGGITVNGGTMDPAFNPAVNNYSVVLEPGSSGFSVTGTKGDNDQVVTPTSITSVNPDSGGMTDITITVRPGSMDGNPSSGSLNIYTISVYKRLPAPLLTLAQRDSSLIVNWSEVAGAAYYEIFCTSDTSAITPADNMKYSEVLGTVQSAAITGLNNGTPYKVWVRAKDKYGITGIPGAAGPATPNKIFYSITYPTDWSALYRTVAGIPDTGSVTPGTVVTLTINSPYGLKQGSFMVFKGAEQVPVTGSGYIYSFTMPDGNVTVQAEFLTGNLGSLAVSAVSGSVPGVVSQLFPQFNSVLDKYSYSVLATSNVTGLQVYGVSDEGATVQVSDNSGFVTGENTVTIRVNPPADSGALSYRTYTITVDKKAANALETLSVSYGTDTEVPLDPAAGIYLLTVPYTADSIDVKAEPFNPENASVAGDGNTPLAEGSNIVSVKVSLVFDTTTVDEKTYTIIVTREPQPPAPDPEPDPVPDPDPNPDGLDI